MKVPCLNCGCLLLVSVLAIAGCGDKKTDAASINIATAKKAMERRLTDPLSVQYRDLVSYSEEVVCGEVNAKNKMGGYVGFKPFVYNGEEFGQVEVNVVPSHIELWCNNNPQKRLTANGRQSDGRWVTLAAEERLCMEAKAHESVACEMADKTRRGIKGEPDPSVKLELVRAGAEKAVVDMETTCAQAPEGTPRKRTLCAAAAKGREIVNSAKQR